MIVANISTLKSLTVTPNCEVDLLGYFTPGDGGGGRFYFDSASAAADDGGTVIAPTSGSGRWKRIYSGAVSVDWFGATGSGDVSAAFVAASVFPVVECSARTYRMDGTIAIKANQLWDFKGATITHTDPSKKMFTATTVDGWTFRGPVVLKGLLVSSGDTGAEEGLVISGCNKYRVSEVGATLFQTAGIHIAAGLFAGSKGDQGQITDCWGTENRVGLLIDNDSAAEYNTVSNFNASWNITGVQIGAGNTIFTGGTIIQNTYGVKLVGGGNNGHGIFSGVNINHNGNHNILADAVTNGHTFIGCHIYGDSSSAGLVRFQNGSTDISITGGVLDAAVYNDSGTNRVSNNKTYSQFSVGGANAAGLIQSPVNF
ncbi:hypothetical protein PMI15_04688 [Polaromonas sp. CF318]|uniref:hypothetical protein n=1 Tax=Polaromonas sp. CF318 TaxID=1144318 RepID=UPI0002714525|nr:hypothetical protein [Polaromonas sp. CF318]EJL77366.1 hypothetical protein PMI15_04688 [Polaromonas sp. CF318]